MSAQIRLLGAIAVRPALLPLISRFEAATGHRVEPVWELNPIIRKQIEGGEPFDVVVINPHYVQELADLGKVSAASQVPFGRIAMGVAAKAGGRALDVGSTVAFAQTLRDARSIAYASEGSSGAYFVGLLERLGLTDEVKPKLVGISGGGTVAAVASGAAELGVVPVSSILAAAPDIVLVGRFPAELQSYIDFAVGISRKTADAEAAKQLADMLTSSAVDNMLAASGVERL